MVTETLVMGYSFKASIATYRVSLSDMMADSVQRTKIKYQADAGNKKLEQERSCGAEERWATLNTPP